MPLDAPQSALRRASGRLLPFAGLFVISAALALSTDRFLTLANLLDVARRVSVINILALGLLVRTPFGRYCYALGGNRQAGFLAGLSIPWILARVYVIAGGAAGLAGMIDAARILTGNPTAGQEYELQVIAAVVIGGASLTGGKGTILGATVGALLMAVLQNGSNLLGISPFVQRMVIGALIVVAVGVDVWRERTGR